MNNFPYKIAGFFLCYNEQEILPHLINHYKQFCTDVYIINNCSTDRTPEIAKEMGCKLINMPPNYNEIDELKYLYIKENCYKQVRNMYDYIIVADADEFLHHKDIFNYLENNKHIDVHKCIGYDMWYNDFNYYKDDYKLITKGRPSPGYNKCALFKSNIDIKWSPGCHSCYVANTDSEIEMRHLKHINVKYLIDRYALLATRRSEINKKNGWGFHVETKANETIRWCEELEKTSIKMEW